MSRFDLYLRAAGGANLATLSRLFRSGPQGFGRSCLAAYGAARSELVPGLPAVALGDILGDRRPRVSLNVLRYEDGMLPSDQALVLLAVAVAEDPREVLEIGTYMGHTARLLAENLPAATIHTVDLPTGEGEPPAGPLPKDDFHLIRRRVVGREFRDTPLAGRVRQHLADSAEWDFRLAGRPGLVFIDGSHTYEYCRSDSEKSYAVAADRAVFLWHDCDDGHPGVVRLLREWRRLGRDVRRIAGTPLAY